MNGPYFTFGLGILNDYYPGYVFSANYLAGASASRYPAGTLVTGLFQDQFTNPASRDYTVRDRQHPEGRGAGRDRHRCALPGLAMRVDGVVEGRPPQDAPTFPCRRPRLHVVVQSPRLHLHRYVDRGNVAYCVTHLVVRRRVCHPTAHPVHTRSRRPGTFTVTLTVTRTERPAIVGEPDGDGRGAERGSRPRRSRLPASI